MRKASTGLLKLLLWTLALPVFAQDKPNILVLWGDDIGVHNISAYNHGIMGYQTPNIDRIANEGALFTDAYAQQSCTAGRASFVLGQHPFRTGLLTIGMPGSDHGIPDWAPTIGDLLKEHGYMTAQFGKNHLGDQDKHLPTNHGFDEFFGNLYHLNAEEEPENEDYPGDMVLADGRSFRFEWFASLRDFVNHLVGAVLMGFGGVLALGCTIGQGITGISTLAIGSFIAFGGIVFGPALTMKVQYYKLVYEQEASFMAALISGFVDLHLLPKGMRNLEAV